MKKGLKKLKLSRETLLALDHRHLQQAAGGDSTDCTYTNCCSGQDTCATCEMTCTSKYC